MKIILFIVGIFLVFTNACNQNTQSNTSKKTTSEKAVVSNNSSSINNNVKTEEVITEIPIEQTKTENTTVNNLENKKEYFKLLSATSESWTAGIQSGGSGIEYYLEIKITTAEKIVFDTLWANNKAFEIFISKESGSVSSEPIKYGNGDIITLRATDLKNQHTKMTTVIPPINYNGTGLLGYTVNDNREYFIIKEIKKQNSPNRP